ncbi:MAG: hypothetical protein EBY92_06460, partial [Actinobacteria bacterium]|nr:hypothetical protein [Actinomycetota bacterium]
LALGSTRARTVLRVVIPAARTGIITAMAALVLLAVSTVTTTRRTAEFDEADAEILEHGIRRVVDSGADETAVRDLVRRAITLGRRTPE